MEYLALAVVIATGIFAIVITPIFVLAYRAEQESKKADKIAELIKEAEKHREEK